MVSKLKTTYLEVYDPNNLLYNDFSKKLSKTLTEDSLVRDSRNPLKRNLHFIVYYVGGGGKRRVKTKLLCGQRAPISVCVGPFGTFAKLWPAARPTVVRVCEMRNSGGVFTCREASRYMRSSFDAEGDNKYYKTPI